mmetsp:Transcript_8750/g.13066  ORF Transcript_8750/g.13066 Transcript_8750/m.13066 type:complete len:106 (+) Transcript_8750:66-383(+)
MAAADKKDKAAAREASQLAEVDKYVEEKGVDKSKAMKAISSIKEEQKNDVAARMKREKELAKVKISAKNVELMMTEMEMSKATAERTLKIHNDDVVAALRSLLKV